MLRGATGRRNAFFITCHSDRYAIDPALVDTDLWQLEAALREASTADPAARRAALERAAELARGEELLARHEWAEAERECLRRHAADALCSLSRAHLDAGEAEGALTALEDALRVDAEDVYQRLIRPQLQLDRPAGTSSGASARSTWIPTTTPSNCSRNQASPPPAQCICSRSVRE